MTAREIEDAAREVAALQQIASAQRALGIASAPAAVLTAAFDARLAVAFGAGAALEALLAFASTTRCRGLVASLALRREALTDGHASPLLSPTLAATELDAVLRRIHGGIHPRQGRKR